MEWTRGSRELKQSLLSHESVDEVIEGESIADIVFYHHCGVINEVICSDDIQIFAGAAKPA